MKLEVLVSTMNQTDYSLIEKMNIKSNVIVINQCDNNNYAQFEKDGYTAKWFSFNEKGVGLSRNNALMRSESEISLMADDDITYVDNYKELVLEAFQKNPQVDVFIFNVKSKEPQKSIFQIKKMKKLNLYNAMKYGTVRVAFRTEKIKEKNIFFSLLFGGGAKYSHGEDSLFIAECIRKGLKVYTHPAVIAYIETGNSTWFNGYTEKYFFDQGVFFRCLSKNLSKFLCFYFAIKHVKLYKNDFTMSKVLKLMLSGCNSI